MTYAPSMDHVNDYLRHLELDLHRARSTVRNYRAELTRLVDAGVALTPRALGEWVAHGEDGKTLAANTRNRRLVILRGFLRFLVKQGHLASDPSAGIERARVPRDRRTPVGVLELRRVLGALHAERASWRRTRDEAILLVLFNVGLRVSEVRNLDLEQVDLEHQVLQGALRKGGGYVDAPLNDEATAAVAAWLAARPASDDPAVFVGGLQAGRLTVRSIQKRLQRLGRAAGLRTPLHPHELRHAHATALYRAGIDIRVIGQSLNHASIRTTQRYVHTDVETLRAALGKLPSLAGPPPPDENSTACTLPPPEGSRE